MIKLADLLREEQAGMWNRNSALDFLDLIGQTSVKFTVANRGTSTGDFGVVTFKFSSSKLVLDFADRDEAHSAIVKISKALSNPYSFEKSRDKDTEIIVTLSE